MEAIQKRVYDEIVRRFPEVKRFVFDGDEALPYLMFGHIAQWLASIATPSVPEQVVQRLVEFDRWCSEQPPGTTADDDIHTMNIVGLREKLFEDDQLLPLIPRLMDRKEMLTNREYLIGWVGKDRYDAALRVFGKVFPHRGRGRAKGKETR